MSKPRSEAAGAQVTEEYVRDLLVAQGLSVADFGAPDHLSLESLAREVNGGLCQLRVDEAGKLLRHVSLVVIDVTATAREGVVRLLEEEQIRNAGRLNPTHQHLHAKLRRDEAPAAGVVRALRDRFGFSAEVAEGLLAMCKDSRASEEESKAGELFRREPDIIEATSPSYPGLQTRYAVHRVAMHFPVVLSGQGSFDANLPLFTSEVLRKIGLPEAKHFVTVEGSLDADGRVHLWRWDAAKHSSQLSPRKARFCEPEPVAAAEDVKKCSPVTASEEDEEESTSIEQTHHDLRDIIQILEAQKASTTDCVGDLAQIEAMLERLRRVIKRLSNVDQMLHHVNERKVLSGVSSLTDTEAESGSRRMSADLRLFISSNFMEHKVDDRVRPDLRRTFSEAITRRKSRLLSTVAEKSSTARPSSAPPKMSRLRREATARVGSSESEAEEAEDSDVAAFGATKTDSAASWSHVKAGRSTRSRMSSHELSMPSSASPSRQMERERGMKSLLSPVLNKKPLDNGRKRFLYMSSSGVSDEKLLGRDCKAAESREEKEKTSEANKAIIHAYRDSGTRVEASIDGEWIRGVIDELDETHPARIKATSEVALELESLRASGSEDMWVLDAIAIADRTTAGSLLVSAELHIVPYVADLGTSMGVMRRYLKALHAKYVEASNPFHNETHAALVTHATRWLMSHSAGLDNMPVHLKVACATAAAAHDAGHFGRNNAFCINTGHPLALTYNDRSVLENMHAATCFELMQAEDCDVLRDLDKERRRSVRDHMVDLILATDMASHFEFLGKFRVRVAMEDFNPQETPEDTRLLARCCIKAADLGHTALPWNLHEAWVLRLLTEFYEQGDEEQRLGLPVSPLCQRTGDIPEFRTSQKGFLQFVVSPLFKELSSCITDLTDVCVSRIDKNCEEWTSGEVSPELVAIFTADDKSNELDPFEDEEPRRKSV